MRPVRTGRPFASIDLAQVSFFTNGTADEEFAVGAVEDIKKPIAIRFDKQFARLPLVDSIDREPEFPWRHNRKDRAA